MCFYALLLIYKLEVHNITIVTNNLTYFFDQLAQLQVRLLFFLLFVLMRLLFEGGARVYFVGKPADRQLNKIHKVTVQGLIDADRGMWSLSVLLSKRYSIPEKMPTTHLLFFALLFTLQTSDGIKIMI